MSLPEGDDDSSSERAPPDFIDMSFSSPGPGSMA
jgi:hypothetical protein